jgi:hypothetical protein
MTNEIKTSLEILESLLGRELKECTKIAGFQHHYRNGLQDGWVGTEKAYAI